MYAITLMNGETMSCCILCSFVHVVSLTLYALVLAAPNSSYTFQVRGNTSAGYGNFSVPEYFETDEDGRFLWKRENED